MTDLIEFLRARVAEDEQWALAAKGVHWQWAYSETDEVVTPDPVTHEYLTATNREGDEVVTCMDLRSVEREDTSVGSLPLAWAISYAEEVDSSSAGHIVRHDPARVLREVEAKRRILDEHYGGTVVGGCAVCAEGTWDTIPIDLPCPTVKLLALPYADHPDYRPEWRP